MTNVSRECTDRLSNARERVDDAMYFAVRFLSPDAGERHRDDAVRAIDVAVAELGRVRELLTRQDGAS